MPDDPYKKLKELGYKRRLTVRESCRLAKPLTGAEAQALEHALTQVENLLDEERRINREASKQNDHSPSGNPDAWTRVPGLFRRHEFAEVLKENIRFYFEAAGKADDGTELFSIWEQRQKL